MIRKLFWIFLFVGVVAPSLCAGQDAVLPGASNEISAVEQPLDPGSPGGVTQVTDDVASAIPSPVTNEADSPAPETIDQGTVQEDVTISEAGEVSLDFRDADIQNVLKILSYKSGVNIVAGPEVTGLVTIKLSSVPWKQALDVILQTYGYTYEQRGNIIVVTTVDNMKKRREDATLLAEQEPLLTETFILNYAKAADVIASIEKMKTERGSINFDDRTNTLIARDTRANLERIKEVIIKLDTVTPQIMIETRIVETNLNNDESLGIQWAVSGSINGMKRPTIAPFNSSDSNDFNLLPDAIPAAGAATFTYGTLDFSQTSMVLKMLSQRVDTNILSNPRIVTLDNQTAKIEVGTDYPIPNYAYNEEKGSYTVDGFNWRTVGIVFTVTPHVNSTGFVTLDLMPEVSAKDGSVAFDNISLPLVSKKTTKTRVMIKDGDTLVIGGMIKDQKTVTKHKLPILGDIPLLGLLFQQKVTAVVKTDLLIFVTPHIITSGVAVNEKSK